MKHQVSGAAISRTATSSNPAVGSIDVAYTSVAADLATVGKHDCEWQVTFSGGAVHTFPGGSYNVVNVLPDLN